MSCAVSLAVPPPAAPPLTAPGAKAPPATAPPSASSSGPALLRDGSNDLRPPSGTELPPADPAPRPSEALAAGMPSLPASPSTPIDLDGALRLAGVENPQIQIALQRVSEAVADRQLAAAQLMLPSLNAGSNYDNHTGPLQQSSGNILRVNRSSLFAGAGANAIAAGSVNIPGVVWNMNMGVAAFNFLQSRQMVREREFDNQATINEMTLQVAVGYLELLRLEQATVIAMGIRDDAREIARLTANYAHTGQGREADANRAATELRARETEVLELQGKVIQASAKLCQLLNLDPSVRLTSAERLAVPKQIVPTTILLPELIGMGMLQRPELNARRAAIQRALYCAG